MVASIDCRSTLFSHLNFTDWSNVRARGANQQLNFKAPCDNQL